MKVSGVILIIFLLIFSYCQAQGNNYAVDLVPAELREKALATIRDERIVIQMLSPNKVSVRIFKAVTVYNKNGEEHAEISLFYNKARKIKQVKGAIFNEFGIETGKFTLKEFRDQSASGQNNLYDDVRIKEYIPNVNSYPYTVIYEAEIDEGQNLFIPAWYPDYSYDVSVEKSSYTIQKKPTEIIRIDQQNYPGEPDIEEQVKTKSYIWQVKNLKAKRSEPYSPPRYLSATRVRVVPEYFEYYKRNGRFSNWKELGTWIYQNLLADKRKLSPSTIQQVKELTAHIDSPKKKAEVLYKYLQDKTRYISIQVGIGGLEPFSAESVDHLGYGDCKALVNYMQSLLDVVDIPSYYCIVEAGSSKRDVSKDFANIADGNHIILCIPFQNDTTWLECTSQLNPFGFLGDFTDDRLVLACTPEGGKLMRTPKYGEHESLQYRKAELSILADGSLKGSLKTTFQGTQLDNHLYNSRLREQEQIKNLKRWYDIDNISFQNIHYTIPDDDPSAIMESMDVFMKNYVVSSDKYLILQPNIFNFSSPIPAIRNRNNEVYINRGFTDIDEISFTLPDNIEGFVIPENKVLETPMATYELKTSVQDGILTSYRKLQFREGIYPAESYSEFHEFMSKVHSSDKGKYNLSKK